MALHRERVTYCGGMGLEKIGRRSGAGGGGGGGGKTSGGE